jgi:hypothetical protein
MYRMNYVRPPRGGRAGGRGAAAARRSPSDGAALAVGGCAWGLCNIPRQMKLRLCTGASLAVFLTAGGARAEDGPAGYEAAGVPFFCKDDISFVRNMRFVQGLCCKQQHEDCGASWLPHTCRHMLCADVVVRAWRSCSSFLAHNRGMWGDRASQLQSAALSCNSMTWTHRSATHNKDFALSAQKHPIKTCYGVLVDGRGTADTGWHQVVEVQPTSPGFSVSLDFTAFLGTPHRNHITIYDGPIKQGHAGLLAEIKNQTGPTRAIVSSPGLSLTVVIKYDVPEAPLAFSASIRCIAPCKNGNEFSHHMTTVQAECCDEPTESCAHGLPNVCNEGCAAVMRNAKRQCASFFAQLPALALPLNTALERCPAVVLKTNTVGASKCNLARLRGHLTATGGLQQVFGFGLNLNSVGNCSSPPLRSLSACVDDAGLNTVLRSVCAAMPQHVRELCKRKADAAGVLSKLSLQSCCQVFQASIRMSARSCAIKLHGGPDCDKLNLSPSDSACPTPKDSMLPNTCSAACARVWLPSSAVLVTQCGPVMLALMRAMVALPEIQTDPENRPAMIVPTDQQLLAFNAECKRAASQDGGQH